MLENVQKFIKLAKVVTTFGVIIGTTSLVTYNWLRKHALDGYVSSGGKLDNKFKKLVDFFVD